GRLLTIGLGDRIQRQDRRAAPLLPGGDLGRAGRPAGGGGVGRGGFVGAPPRGAGGKAPAHPPPPARGVDNPHAHPPPHAPPPGAATVPTATPPPACPSRAVTGTISACFTPAVVICTLTGAWSRLPASLGRLSVMWIGSVAVDEPDPESVPDSLPPEELAT